MAYRWPDAAVFSRLELHVEEQWCQTCGSRLRVCDHRHRRVFTLQGPLQVVCKLVHCPERVCPAHPRTLSPEAETALAMPWWVLGWDVVCWLGHRRFARHWAVGQIRTELADTYQIRLSDDAIERYSQRYQQMLAARQHDPQQLAAAYADVDAVILSIDGLQPEKGHETLYVVRELARKRVWFAEALLSSATAEVRSSQGCHTAIAPITFYGMWPSRSWKPTATPRCTCDAPSGGCAPSNRRSYPNSGRLSRPRCSRRHARPPHPTPSRWMTSLR